MNEDKATRYHRLGRRAALLSTGGTLVLLTGLMLTGGSVALRDWAKNLAAALGASEVRTLVVGLYVLALSVVVDVALLPVSFYKGFLLERRYGLATQTTAHWLKDYGKAVLVGLLFAEVGAIFVYSTLRRWPETWWIVSGLGYSAATIALVKLAPVLLMPLFFRFRPLQKVALRERLTALATKANTSVMGVYEWTLSDRTRKGNAALAGMGKTRRIIVSDTLLAEYSDDEIEVILAHELAHHVHRDIWMSVMYDIVLTFAGFFAAHHALRFIVPLFGLQNVSDPAGAPVLLTIAGGLAFAVKPLLNAISRSHERRADSYALRLTKNPSAFVSAIRRLGQQNLAEENPSWLVQILFYTHPPIKERLKAAQHRAAF